jgi:hypothetical protein
MALVSTDIACDCMYTYQCQAEGSDHAEAALISRNRGEVCEEGFQEHQNNSVIRSMLMWLLQCLGMAHVSLELFPCLFKVVAT